MRTESIFIRSEKTRSSMPLRMIRCVLLYLFCLAEFTMAQSVVSDQRYDSLTNALKRSSADSAKIKTYHLLSAHFGDINPPQALQYEDSALALSKRINDKKFIAISLTNLGIYYRKRTDFPKSYSYLVEAFKALPPSSKWLRQTYLEAGITLQWMTLSDSAMQYLNQGLKLLRQYPDPVIEGSIYNTLGNIKRSQSNYVDALEYYYKAEKLFQSQKYLKGQTIALSNIGNIHNLMDNPEQAIVYAQQSLETALAAGVKSSIAYSYRLMGRIYRKQGKLDDALKAYMGAIDIYAKLLAKRELGETHLSIGNIYFDKGQYANALREYKQTINLSRQIGDTLNMTYNYIAAGETYLRIKQYENARTYLDSAVLFSKKIKNLGTLSDAYSELSQIYEAEGNYKLAKQYFAEHIVLKDSLNMIQNRRAARELEARYQSEKKDDEIRILNAENQLKETQIRSKNNERNYLFVLLGLLVIVAAVIYNRYKLKLKANQKLQELDLIKSRFFANVSHEFRTPLTLIIGPLEEKLAIANDASQKEDYLLMLRNAKRLQNLTNQVLDLSKLEAGSMELHIQEGDLAAVIRLIGGTFSSLADRKGMTYTQEIFDSSSQFCYDRDKLEKMLNNLLSNAFKFTPSGGSVYLKALIENGKLIVEVKDSGIGIPPQKLGLIFNRFYQVDDSITRSTEGSGIGLALTRELADLHRGKLEVSSREGFGSVFTLTLSVSREAFRDLPITVESAPAVEPLTNHPLSPDHEITATVDDESKPLVLVAEDNPDMQKFIFDLLKDKYRVICVGNGKEAFERAQAVVPDIVITDWMMPVMDGRTCCEKLKSTDATSHIPVLMLTARADQSSKLEGLETGADDYLIKPFSTNELTVRIHNLIEQRKKLRAIFSKEIILQPKHISLPSRDATFMTKLLALIESKYAEAEFSVDDISDEVSMSRMQLHRKLKALTDQSPGEFLRRYRLERAKQLLSVNGTQVSEVCFKVGFNNVSHFSKSFREFTGTTPTEFMESLAVKNK